ncbi:MAG: formylglycine-generating enzyme family protein [Gemmatimonadetes bacterium]|nr:formylglycine-generating enzyme family protein [Gemmatimonadota bacterium]
MKIDFRSIAGPTVLATVVLAGACSSDGDVNAATDARAVAAVVESALPTPAPGDAPPGMVWVSGGGFMMGGADQYAESAELPVHGVLVNGFFMDAHTVTNAQFAAFVKATGYVTVAERAPDVADLMRQLPAGTPPPDAALLVPGSLVFAPTSEPVDLRDWSQWWAWTPGADWRHPDGPKSSIAGKDNYPVVQVAWNDAVAYADWMGRRLPTEAEWEFAARGGNHQTAFAWGDAAMDAEHPQAHIYEGSFPTHAAAPKPVGSYPATGFGLFDMSGNVWQWTLDWYRPDTYARDAALGLASNPTGPRSGLDPRTEGQPTRVVRGGSFLCNDTYCRGYRVSARSPGAPDSGASHIGFRTVMTVDQWTRWKSAKGDQ